MIHCLESLVDLSLCGERKAGVWYLDDLPGITIQSVDASASDTQETFRGVMRAVKANASRKLTSDLRVKQEYWKPKIISCGAAGFYEPSKMTPEIGAYGWRGVAIQSYSSNYSGLFVKNIQFYATAAGDFTLIVYDLTTGQAVDTITSAVTEGYNLIQVHTGYGIAGSVRRLGFVYDASLFVPTLNALYEDCDCALNTRACGYRCGYYRMVGITSTAPVPLTSNAIDTNYAYGLRIDFDVRCLLDMFICANEDLFKDAYLNLCAYLLVRQAYHSKRLNRFVTMATDKEIELMTYYETQYRELLARIQDEMFYGDGCCYQCPQKQVSTYVRMYP